jgi:transcriptional regulator GlxA family with amidase domain
MEERRDRLLPIPALARAVGIARRQLERLFIRETGLSPGAFAAKMRVQYAEWLLTSTDRSLTEIALACGYADLAHFSRSYKSAYGMSPSAWREVYKEAILTERAQSTEASFRESGLKS